MTIYYKKSNQSFWPSLMVFAIFGLDLFSSLPGASVVLLKTFSLGVITLCAFVLFINYIESTPPLCSKFIFLYLFLLGIRLLVDFVIERQYFFLYKNPATLMSFYIITMVLPAWMFSTRKFDIDFDKLVFYTQILTLLVLGISVNKILSGEITAINQGRFEGEGMLDTIYLGHQGLTLFILSLYKFKRKKILNMSCGLIGLLTIFLAGSRGPMVALCVCGLLFFIMNSHSNKSRIITTLGVIIVFIFYVPILKAINNVFISHGFHSFDRITKYLLGEMIGGDGRQDIYSHAFDLILRSPLFGYQYLLEDGSYVHNLFIEQYMALGIIGGTLFTVTILYICHKGYKASYHSNNKGFRIYYILFIQYIMFGMFSRTVVALPQLWITLSIVIHYSSNKLLYGRKQ